MRSMLFSKYPASSLTIFCWLEPKNQFAGLFAVVLFVNALSATQDIATDGLAVEILDQRERGLANGLQVGAYRLGMVLGGGVLLIFFAHLGWRLSFLAMAAAVVAATVPTLLHREKLAHGHLEAQQLRQAVHFLRLRGAWPLLAMLFLFKFGEALATTMLRPFMADHGMGLEDVGWMLGTVKQLGVPTSSVSRAVGRLEEQLGAKLFVRSTRKTSLTPAGRVFYEHASKQSQS